MTTPLEWYLLASCVSLLVCFGILAVCSWQQGILFDRAVEIARELDGMLEQALEGYRHQLQRSQQLSAAIDVIANESTRTYYPANGHYLCDPHYQITASATVLIDFDRDDTMVGVQVMKQPPNFGVQDEYEPGRISEWNPENDGESDEY